MQKRNHQGRTRATRAPTTRESCLHNTMLQPSPQQVSFPFSKICDILGNRTSQHQGKTKHPYSLSKKLAEPGTEKQLMPVPRHRAVSVKRPGQDILRLEPLRHESRISDCLSEVDSMLRRTKLWPAGRHRRPQHACQRPRQERIQTLQLGLVESGGRQGTAHACMMSQSAAWWHSGFIFVLGHGAFRTAPFGEVS